VQTIKTNVHGTINMLGLAKRTGAKFLQASTSEVYGDPLEHPQNESYWGNVNPIGIRSCYDEGKRCAETLCMDYQRQYNVNTKIARIFNTYGPNMDVNDGRVVSNFIIQALENKALTIFGDGSQTRSFCYVDDLVEGLIRLMQNETINTPVNLGNENEFTIKQLANKVNELTGGNQYITYTNLPEDDPTQRKPNTKTAFYELNKWKPKIQLNEGLEKTIEYFKVRLKENSNA
jgi:UDP-glucuronate decarboxylase